MSNFYIAHERDQLFRRLERLTADSVSTNGVVSGHSTVRHLSADLDVILGDREPIKRGNMLTRTLGRWLVFHVLPWPEKLPRVGDELNRFVAPEGAATGDADFNRDFEALVERIRRFDARCKAGSLAPHPVYGKLGRDGWGTYMYLHIDWHLSTLKL